MEGIHASRKPAPIYLLSYSKREHHGSIVVYSDEPPGTAGRAIGHRLTSKLYLSGLVPVIEKQVETRTQMYSELVRRFKDPGKI